MIAVNSAGTTAAGAPWEILAPRSLVIFMGAAAVPVAYAIVVASGLAPAAVMMKALCVVSYTTVATAAVNEVCNAAAASAKLVTALKLTSALAFFPLMLIVSVPEIFFSSSTVTPLNDPLRNHAAAGARLNRANSNAPGDFVALL
ncbi:Uncharacterised protein [Acinetobacter baumannii]|nr:Uncharacterised protein [Acinetobacter baumannii]